MSDEQDGKKYGEGLLAGLSADTLRGRQSVRATFRLPSQVIALLSLAANQLGLKQKSLFDQLVEDREVLKQLAQAAGSYSPSGEQRQQKTFVVSRNSLLSLEYVAKACGLPRDLLVELSIRRLLPVMSSEQEKQKKRRAVLTEMESFLQQGQALWASAEQLLGETDDTTRQLAMVLLHCERAVNDLRQAIDQGKEIEGYQ